MSCICSFPNIILCPQAAVQHIQDDSIKLNETDLISELNLEINPGLFN